MQRLLRLHAEGDGVASVVECDCPRVALLLNHVARVVVRRLAQHGVVHRKCARGEAGVLPAWLLGVAGCMRIQAADAQATHATFLKKLPLPALC